MVADRCALLVNAGNFSTISGVRVEGFAIFPQSAPTNFAATVWGNEPWRTLDTGVDPASAWRATGFDDTAWKSGIGEFGYGDSDERTRISFKGSAANKHITSWIRREFDASSTPISAGIYMRVDDGAVVYVNGVEVGRDNMPAGVVTPATLAFARPDNNKDDVRYFPIDPALILPGRNTIGVEVHQTSPSSDDLTFFATFRHRFTASGTPNDLTLTLRIDDGAIVRINGVEAYRFNISTTAINFRTRAVVTISGSNERLDRTITLDPTLVMPGTNVITVEVHQHSPGSSDITFLASLTGRF